MTPKVIAITELLKLLTPAELHELDAYVNGAKLPVNVIPNHNNCNVYLQTCGPNKIAQIKALRTLQPHLGLAEAKHLVEAAPCYVAHNITRDAASTLVNELNRNQGFAHFVTLN